MKIVRRPSVLRREIIRLRKSGRSIGFVPTMGALHEGHLSLVRRSVKRHDVTIVSIFVNPLQFGRGEDFKRYPKNLKRDLGLLAPTGATLVFVPSAEDLYGSFFQTTVKVEGVSQGLCGKSRPGHFAGVATVVLKLLNLVAPDTLYLGQKDYQQCRVVDRMVQDLNLPVRVEMVPTVRETDGLAMSSRNVYLSADERVEAPKIYQALLKVRRLAREGERRVTRLKEILKDELLKATGCRIDYAEIVDATTLKEMSRLEKGKKALCAVAVFFGKTRLIDNIVLSS